MEEQIIKYRKKHPKCKFCKYYKHKEIEIGMRIFESERCLLKDKNIKYSFLPKLCKYYKAKEK